MKTFYIETWGCQMNRHDSERLAGLLIASGYRPSSDIADADLILLNTCSVREKAVQKVKSRLGELTHGSSHPAIGLCGCVAEQLHRSWLDMNPSIGFVLGPGQIHHLPEAVKLLEQNQRTVFSGFNTHEPYTFHETLRSNRTRGMVTAIEGCNEHCTYCIVPYTRGPERSRPLAEILQEIQTLAEQGIPEVEILGQTVNSYRCPETGADLADLLRRAASIDTIRWVRFLTSHPRYFNAKLIAAIADEPKVAPYLHLPVQSGSTSILRRMHRRYTRNDYLDLIHQIRTARPHINLSTDIIVGFPGETEADFEDTLSLLATVRFGQVFAFAFSPRPGTPAARYDDPVPETMKKERLQRLFHLTDRIALELNQERLGTTLDVLIDGISRRSPDHWQGRTPDNRVVNFPRHPDDRIGHVVTVRIERAGPHSLFASRTHCATAHPLPHPHQAPNTRLTPSELPDHN